DLRALDGDGNVCRRKLLTANDQPDASKKSPHTEKPHAKRSQRGSRLSRGFLQSAAGLHQKCGRAILVPAMTGALKGSRTETRDVRPLQTSYKGRFEQSGPISCGWPI